MSDVTEPFVYKLGVEVPHDVIFVAVHHSIKILPDEVFLGRRCLKEVMLPEGLEAIGEGAFGNCSSLERINFPSTLIKIGTYAFYVCLSLKEVQLPERLEEIGSRAFRNCVSLERINFPSSLIKIGTCAFYECQSLKEVALPEGLKEIWFRAFWDCVSLERIDCTSTLIKIGTCAFYECQSLSKVKLAGGIVTIEANAFQNCRSLEGIMMPSKAFVLKVDSDGEPDGEILTCRLILTDDETFTLTRAKQIIISPEHLNNISSSGLGVLEIENVINTIMNDRGHTREENIERVLALIKYHALFEVSTILELTLWKNKLNAMDDSNLATRADCRVMCGGDDIIPGVMSYL